MHSEMRREIRKRRSICKIAKRKNYEYYWTLFLTQRNKICCLIKIAQHNYYEKMCEYLHNHSQELSSKHWWNICKYMFNGKQINTL